jgi:hypothetical protein
MGNSQVIAAILDFGQVYDEFSISALSSPRHLTETSGHFLWSCEASSAIWAACNRRLQKSTIKDGDFLRILEHLITRLEPQDMELLAVVEQKMWLRRNRLVFGGTIQPLTCLVECAKVQRDA